MCIRDSIKAGVWSFKVTHPDFVDFYVSAYEIKVGQGVIKTSIMAVSYTHLRAHETVLDLVCRLLLEKKKYTFECTISSLPYSIKLY